MAKTREQKRNERAEKVCRELRYQFAVSGRTDYKKLMEYLMKWMRVAKKNKYNRP